MQIVHITVHVSFQIVFLSRYFFVRLTRSFTRRLCISFPYRPEPSPPFSRWNSPQKMVWLLTGNRLLPCHFHVDWGTLRSTWTSIKSKMYEILIYIIFAIWWHNFMRSYFLQLVSKLCRLLSSSKKHSILNELTVSHLKLRNQKTMVLFRVTWKSNIWKASVFSRGFIQHAKTITVTISSNGFHQKLPSGYLATLSQVRSHVLLSRLHYFHLMLKSLRFTLPS